LAAIELTEKKSQVCWDARENPKRGILSLLPARLRTTERDHSERMLASPAFSPQEKKKTRERGERLFSNPICTYSPPILHLCQDQARRASRCGKGRRTCTEQGPDVTVFGVIFLPFPVCYGYIFDIRRINGIDMDMIRDAQPRRTRGESALLIRIDPLAPSSHNRRACAGMAILSRLSIVAAPCCPGAARQRRRVS